MTSEARRLRQEREEIRKECEAMIASPGRLSPDQRRKFDRLMDEANDLEQRIDRLEMGPPPNSNDFGLEPDSRIGKQYRQEFRNYLRTGNVGSSLTERRDMGTGGGNALQGTGGGYFVPVGFVNEVEQAMKFYGSMLQSSTIMKTATGQPLPYPTSNDTSAVGELVGEGVQVTTQDVTIGSVIFGAFKYSTKLIRVSLELLMDSAFDIEKFLTQEFANRIGRIINTHCTVGTGSGQPTGIVTAATNSGITVIGDDNATTPDPTKEVGYLDLTNLVHSIDPLYREGAAFMFHDSTLAFLKRLKDKYGRPIWMPSLASGVPDKILGYEYFVNNDLDQLAANKKVVLFGQLRKYVIRQVKELSVLRLVERFADYGQVGFLGFFRADGNLLDAGTHPVKYLVTHS